jgi:hypothetical protein
VRLALFCVSVANKGKGAKTDLIWGMKRRIALNYINDPTILNII